MKEKLGWVVLGEILICVLIFSIVWIIKPEFVERTTGFISPKISLPKISLQKTFMENSETTTMQRITTTISKITTTTKPITTVTKQQTTTSTPITTTTIPTNSASCKLFNMKIDGVTEFDEEGKNKRVVVDLTATYTGIRENQYTKFCVISGMGCYYFELKVDKGYYYEFEYYNYCPYCSYEKKFELDTVMPEDVITGCLDFELLKDTKPVELIFYDKYVDDTCHILIR